ncbi:MAG: GntR family transcriptional regulator [Nitrospira sp.]
MESPDQYPTSNSVVRLLLWYLQSHPDAKDTAEGIEHWWLRAHGVTVDRMGVRKALNDLVARGWLIRRGSMSECQIYGLNPTRRRELQQVLESNIEDLRSNGRSRP